MVRLVEASARIRLSDAIEATDAERAVDLVETSLAALGADPETGELDTDEVETGEPPETLDYTPADDELKRQRQIKGIVGEIERNTTRVDRSEWLFDVLWNLVSTGPRLKKTS